MRRGEAMTEQQIQKILTFLGFAARSKNLVFGKDMLREYITDPGIAKKIVIIARDTGDRVKRDLKIRCQMNNVKYLELFEKAELSKAIGKESISAVGISDENLVDGILKLLPE